MSARRPSIPGPPAPVRWLVHAGVWGAALSMAAPLLWMVATALKTDPEAISPDVTLLPAGPPTQWQWGNFARAWEQANLGAFYRNSIIVAVAVTGLSTAHNLLAAYAFARLRFRGRDATFALTIATMLLPPQVSFIFAYLACGVLGYVDALPGLIVPFLASAFGIFYLRQAILGVPMSLVEAARVDGMGEAEVVGSVVVPTVRPAIAALAIFTFMGTWNAFFWPFVIVDSEARVTLPLAVARLSAGYYVSSWPMQMAAAALITLPTVVVFLLFQRAFVRGIALTGGKG